MYLKSNLSSVEVFRTNVGKRKQANLVIRELEKEFPDSAISFDLEDCDRVLRFECTRIVPAQIIAVLEEHGYLCEILL